MSATRATSSGRPHETARGAPTATLVLAALAAITAAGFVLRLVGIDQTLYQDEYFTYEIVTRNGLRGVWHAVYHTSITPPLHYYLAWLSVQFGGDPTVLVRLPSLVLGTATIPLVFLVGRRLEGPLVGLLAATFLALSPFAIWYSDEARNYATLMFLIALSLYALMRAIRDDGRRWWALYAVCACAALWCHYTAVFVVAAEGLWLLWTQVGRRRLVLILQAAIVAGWLPWLPGYLSQRQNDLGIHIVELFGPLTPGRAFTVPLQALVGHPLIALRVLPGGKGLVLALAVIILVLGAVIAVRRAPPALPPLRPDHGLVLILALATPVGVVLYALAGTSLLIPRNLSASVPALVVLAAALVGALARVAPARVASVPIVAMAVVLALDTAQTLRPENQRPPYREATRYLDRVAAGSAPVVESQPFPLVRAYFPPTTIDLYLRHHRGRVYQFASGDGPAWAEARAGRDVYLVAAELRFSNVVGSRRQAAAAAGLSRRVSLLGGPDGRARLRGRKTFAGLVPVQVSRYRGAVSGRLERRGRREIISWSRGKRVLVSPGVARGLVESVSSLGQPLTISGWALRADRPRPVDWVLFFARDRLFAVSADGFIRPDLVKRAGPSALLGGFRLSSLPPPARRATIRAFGVVGNRASELPLSGAVRRALR